MTNILITLVVTNAKPRRTRIHGTGLTLWSDNHHHPDSYLSTLYVTYVSFRSSK